MQLCVLAVLVLFLTVVGSEVVLLLGHVGEAGPVWGAALWTALGLLGAGLAWALSRECLGYLRVRRVDTLRRRLSARGVDPTLPSAVQDWLTRLEVHADAALVQAIAATRSALPASGDIDACRAALDNHVLSTLDRQVEALIRREALRVGVVCSVLPFAAAEGLFTLWRSVNLIRRIAVLHGTRPGAGGTWRLLRRTMMTALAADVTQHAADAVSARLGAITAAAGQGVLTAALVARVGLWAHVVCRPVDRTRSTLGGFVARGAAHRVQRCARGVLDGVAALCRVGAKSHAKGNAGRASSFSAVVEQVRGTAAPASTSEALRS
jgi:putative membrane protein